VAGDGVEEYHIRIAKVLDGSQVQNLLLQVTDERLIERTGGIVQGMSGSPLLQDGKLVGAVTHVLVNDPTRGYAVMIDAMMEEMEN